MKIAEKTLLLLLLSSLINGIFAQPSREILKQKADSIYAEGRILFENYEYEAAIEKFKEALELHAALGISKDMVSGLKSIGDALCKIWKYDSAFVYLDSALIIARKVKDKQKLQGELE